MSKAQLGSIRFDRFLQIDHLFANYFFEIISFSLWVQVNLYVPHIKKEPFLRSKFNAVLLGFSGNILPNFNFDGIVANSLLSVGV